jgi:hypothetical protein
MSKKMRKYIALFVVVLLIFTTMAGCIDIHLFKDLLVPKEDKVIDYTTRRYIVMHKEFNSSIWPIDPENLIESYNEEIPVSIIPLTESVLFDIDVQMESGEEIWEIINDSWPGDEPPEWLKDAVEQLLTAASQRYIEVTITSPEGVEWFHARFNDTEGMDTDRIQSPSEGDWKVHVEGAGIGVDLNDDLGIKFAYHDSVTVDVTILEPAG